MTTPQRYDLVGDYDPGMLPMENGDYVRFEDYEALAKETSPSGVRQKFIALAPEGRAAFISDLCEGYCRACFCSPSHGVCHCENKMNLLLILFGLSVGELVRWLDRR